jgi:hypothetical protein
MKIQFESELMKNHKHAVVMNMKPDDQFQVFQTADGDSLLFSIGSDGVFYLTREARADLTGWNKVSLSEPLRKNHDGAVKAKSFQVSQSPVGGPIQIALVISVNDKEHWLYVAVNNSSSDFGWATNVPWQQIPFDQPGDSTLAIKNTYIRQSKEGLYVVADVLAKDALTFYSVDRYHIDLEKKSGKYWSKPRPIPGLESNYTSLLGRRSTGGHGTYTFGFSDKKPKLDFALLSDESEPEELQLPRDLLGVSYATAITTAPNPDGTTQLFVASGDALYRYPADQQTPRAQPQPIIEKSKLLSGVTNLHGVGDGKTTAIWGLNDKNEIFYTSCPTGREDAADAWSAPLLILTKVMAISSFLNNQEGNHVLFAQTKDNSLIQLTQDPVTTHWQERQIVLPATSPDDYIEANSFTTHIEVTDDSNFPQPNTPVSLSSSSPVSVYVNNIYHVLSPNAPANITTDETGVITIVQEVTSLGGVCYHLKTAGVDTDINPMDKPLDRLKSVKSANDLKSATIPDDNGKPRALWSPGADVDTAFKVFQDLFAVKDLPPNGSINKRSHQPTKKGGNLVETKAGDLFRHIKHAAKDVEHYYVEAEHFCVKIGDTIYHTALDCLAKVANAIEFVFHKLAVAFEDLVKYVGFLFEWDDILRTHKAIKNLFLRYAEDCVANLASSKQTLQDIFNGLEDKVKSWGDIEDDGTTTGSVTAKAQRPKGHQSPQSNWGMHHLKSNAGNGSATGDLPPLDDTSDQPLQALGKMIDGEEQIIADMINNIKINVIDQIHTLSAAEIVKRIIANVLDVLLETAENVLVALVDIFEAVVKGIIDVLDQPVTIPVISPMYKKITHQEEELSMLDLVCLVAAIPVTIVYKIAYGQAPFPDDPYTAGVIAAPDFATLQNICSNHSDDQAPTDQKTGSDKSAAPGSADSSTLQFSQAEEETTNKSSQSGGTDTPRDDLWQDVTGILGAAGAGFVIIAALLKKNPLRKKFALGLNFAGYFPYIAPNLIPALTKKEARKNWDKKQPEYALNDALSVAGICKAGLDMTLSSYDPTAAAGNAINAAGPPAPRKGWVQKWGFFSPLVEGLLNGAWCVPAIWIYKESGKMKDAPQTQQQKIEAIITFVGDMCFNLSGILALTDFQPLKDILLSTTVTSAIVEGAPFASGALNGAYGSLCVFATPMVARGLHYK